MCQFRTLSLETLEKFQAKAELSNPIDEDIVTEKWNQNNEFTNSYCKKFGILKKASILAFYDRTNDAFD
jgi:hypothetical protein